MEEQSDTPRTDATQYQWTRTLDLARDLERELAAATRERGPRGDDMTDDHGQPLKSPMRVIEQRGNWFLLYDQLQVGEAVRHEFRVQKIVHDVALYPGITLAEARNRFLKIVENDYE